MKWLVEIRVKAWVILPAGHSRVIAYEEVEGRNKYEAQHLGYQEFAKRLRYQPSARKLLTALSITENDICAPDAVEI